MSTLRTSAPSSAWPAPIASSVSSLRRLARVLVLGGALTVTWTSVTVRGQILSDLLLFSGALVLLVMDRHRAVHPALWHKVSTRFAVIAWTILIGVALFSGSRAAPLDELMRALRLVVSLTVVPLIVIAFVRSVADAVDLVMALVLSVAVSGLVSMSDAVAGLGLNPYQQAWVAARGFSADRFVALTGHPNIVGYAAASIIPMIPFVWRQLRARVGLVVLVALVVSAAAGLLLSGSRGGALGVVAGVAITAFYVGGRSARRVVVGGALGLVTALVLFADSPLVERVLGGGGADRSDALRAENVRSAFARLGRTLFTGEGLRSVGTIHLGLLALLVAGGIVVFGGVVAWIVTMVRYTRRALASTDGDLRDISLAAMAGGIGALAYLATSPFIYHRYAVMGPALAVAMVNLTMLAGGRARASTADAAAPAEADTAPRAPGTRPTPAARPRTGSAAHVSGSRLRQPR